MAKTPIPRLKHILDAIEDVQAIVDQPGEIDADRHIRLLIERNLEIISEASRHLPAELKERHPDVPWRKVAGIGNVIRHDYDEIAPRLLLDVVREHLPLLERVCRDELGPMPSD